ncbi:hypothetical protein PR202_gb00391 [Eleusine coracana subsp. coracana]|uniref:Uncharacterized protein n=1 Tax=Eleusine coracana subsp. coracana TaxID=191504 RepID=A0AAV5DTW9_ELECO|nr:hypothetical protein PR202_gb00391 [Eleusine coracana subsp. coracana]
MVKRKPATAAAARGSKKRPKRAKSAKQEAKSREENSGGFELDDCVAAEVPLPDTGSAETLVTKSRTVDPVQGIEHSDEDDTEDVMDDTINHEVVLMKLKLHGNSYRDIMYCNKKPFYLKGIFFDDNSYLDQGFTRPKDNTIGLFKKQFGESDDELEKQEQSTKPKDFELLFAGDTDDHFVFGIKFTNSVVLIIVLEKSVKLYSNFYASDIIVASPLALKRIVVVDHADVILMQNWAHLETVFEQLNHVPSKEHGTNVMRIRPWYLDQHARHYRQTILLGSYLTPELNALFNGLCLNYEGKVKMVTEYGGVLPKIQLEVRQVYERFDASSISEADDARFDYFCNKVYPKIQDSDEVNHS